jgi:hypothetical protein
LQVVVPAVKFSLQVLPRDHPPCAPDERVQQGEFAAGQLQRLFSYPGFPRGEVVTQSAYGDRRRRAPERTPPKPGQQPRLEFIVSDGLDQVVLGPGLKPRHPLRDIVQRAHDQHRRDWRSSQEHGHQLKALAIRKSPVQQHCVVGDHLSRLYGLVEASGQIRNEPVAPQRLREAWPQTGVVLHKQDTHSKLR